MTQEGEGDATPPSNGNQIQKSHQVSSHEGQIETTVEEKSGRQETGMEADSSKGSIQGDEENGSNGDQGQSTPLPVVDRKQPAVEVAAQISDDKNGSARPIDCGNIANTEKPNVSGGDNAAEPLDNEHSVLKADRDVQATDNTSEHDGRGEEGNLDSSDNHVESTLQSENDRELATAGQGNETTGKPDQSQNGTGRPAETMTVIFHALLTPTFNFQRGDKVVLRGDSPFSWKPGQGQQLEIQVVKYVVLFCIRCILPFVC